MEIQQNRYVIQGLDVLDICAEFGAPLYIYDGEKIQHQYNRLLNAFKGLNCKIKYPVKALSNMSILKLLKQFGAGLDCVSIQEVKMALHVGFDPKEIVFTPSCVSFLEIKQAVELGVCINIDNISILEQFGNVYGNTVPCGLRFNPHVSAGGNHKIQTGHIDSKFGISIFQKRHVQRIIKANDIQVAGLHVHTGSDILNAESYLQSARIMFELAHEFPGLEFIDFGSGFKVPYKTGDLETDIEEVGKKLEGEYQNFSKTYGKKLELWFEPGKFLVSAAGIFCMRANVIKPTPATVFVGVDSGLNHFIRPMMYGSFHQITNLSNPGGIQRIYTIVGYICETDTFGADQKLNEVREGDILALSNAGAYGFMMSSNYNSRLRPAEVLVWKGKARLIRKRETFEDLLSKQLEIEWD
ncbi:MAG: diaminopimelate decarboxylase [Bacteroidota bacterium]